MKKIISILVLILCIFTSSKAFAKELEPKENTSNTQVFAITFSRAIDVNSLENNIYVLDADKNTHKIKLVTSDDERIVYVVPMEKYVNSGAYRLVISTNVKAKTNDIYLKEAVYRNFTIEADSNNSGGL